jgi:hypothetical protein
MRSFLKTTRLVAENGLYEPSSASGGGGGGGGLLDVLYVSPGGSDVTGDGSFTKPYATISKAFLEVNPSAPTQTWVVVGPGQYTESLVFPPFVSLIAWDMTDSTSVSGTLTLSSAWTAASGSGAYSGVANVAIGGDVTLDFASVSNVDGGFDFANSPLESSVTATGFGAGLGNYILLNESNIDLNFTATGLYVGSRDSIVGGFANLVSTATLQAEWNSLGDSLQDVVTLTGGTQTCVFDGMGTTVTDGLVLNGSTTSYTSTSSGIPMSVTLSGGASPPVITNGANSVAYVPGVPGNWAGSPPTTVQQALDRIAANTGNAHPIP